HRLQAIGLVGGPVVALGEVLIEVVEAPLVGVEVVAGLVVGGGLPAVDPDAAVAHLLEVLDRSGRWCGRVVEGGGDRGAVQGDLGRVVHVLGQRGAGGVEHSRGDVDDVAELATHLAPGGDAGRPVHYQRVPHSPAV